jgi:hypothetical protein
MHYDNHRLLAEMLETFMGATREGAVFDFPHGLVHVEHSSAAALSEDEIEAPLESRQAACSTAA